MGRRFGPLLIVLLVLSLVPPVWHALWFATNRLIALDWFRAETGHHGWLETMSRFFEAHPPPLEGWAALLMFLVAVAIAWRLLARR
jgi:hypothetical protein